MQRLLAEAGAVQALAIEAAEREACGLREKVSAGCAVRDWVHFNLMETCCDHLMLSVTETIALHPAGPAAG